MHTPDFGAILIGAIQDDVTLVWTHWPLWSREQPLLWIIPILFVFGLVRAVMPRRRARGR